jgi:glutamate racemase
MTLMKKHTMLLKCMACNTATALFLSEVNLTTWMLRHDTTTIVTDSEPTNLVQRN